MRKFVGKFHSGYIYKEQNDKRHIFVFGSNLAGRHGKGAALTARNHWGAEYGVPIGRTGQAYAIPTKDKALITLPIICIRPYVNGFIQYAIVNPELNFMVTEVGCKLAGYTGKHIAPLFAKVSSNVYLSPSWKPLLDPDTVEPSLISKLQ